jgi:hypothetical protein
LNFEKKHKKPQKPGFFVFSKKNMLLPNPAHLPTLNKKTEQQVRGIANCKQE